MADPLLNALARNLVQAESLGQEERAEALKKRMAARKSELTREAKADEAVVELTEQTVADVLAKVGDDSELAAEALEAENAKDKPRKSLVSGLESVIAAAQEEAE